MAYIFSNMIGCFVFDNELNVTDKILFRNAEEYHEREDAVRKLFLKHKDLKEPDEAALRKILQHFKNKEYFNAFRDINIAVTKADIKNSVKYDTLIIQAVHSIAEIDIAANKISKVLREWYGLHNPEVSKAVNSHEQLAELIMTKNRNELLKEIGVKPEESFGADLKQSDIVPVKELAAALRGIFELRKMHGNYLESLMKEFCPNLLSVAGASIGSRLIAEAGSMKKLSEVPASTIQIYGAERALFRHMKTGAKMPRHGLIANHPLIMQAEQKMHGRTARALADKIGIAVRVDYFKGEFIGDKLKKSLIERFKTEFL